MFLNSTEIIAANLRLLYNEFQGLTSLINEDFQRKGSQSWFPTKFAIYIECCMERALGNECNKVS